MSQIILLVLGIIYAVRRPRLRALPNAAYTRVPADRFEQWKALELKGITCSYGPPGGCSSSERPLHSFLRPIFPAGHWESKRPISFSS